MSNALNLFLKFIPKKEYSIALTFHNISRSHCKWFEKTLDHLSLNFDFVDPNNLDQIIDKNEKRKIILTFDDGFKSNRALAEKILNPRGIKALFFITYGFIGLNEKESFEFANNNYFPNNKILIKDSKDFLSLNWDDIKWLKENGHKIGAHTNSHPNLKNIKNHNELIKEIVKSADKLEKKISTQVNTFAYPYGSLEYINSQSVAIVKKRFKKAYTNIRGGLQESPNHYLLLRQNISPLMPFWKVNAIVNGKFDWYYKKKIKSLYKI